MKRCIDCGIKKETEEFIAVKSRPGTYVPHCRSCHKLRARKHRTKNKEHYKNYRLKRLYGITLECYTEMLEVYNHSCPVCRRLDDDLVVDHCHITGEVRGLLCRSCNLGLGSIGDNLENAENLVKYLRGDL